MFNGKSREKKGRVSSIFICQSREKPHKYACNIFQDEKLFPPIEGSIRTGLITMGGTQVNITYCPQCEKEGNNLIPIQDFLHSEFRSLLTKIKDQAEKTEQKREEDLSDEGFNEDIYDNDKSYENRIADHQGLAEKDKLETSEFSTEDSSLISIPEKDHKFQPSDEKFSRETNAYAFNLDIWIEIIDSEREKEVTKLTLRQIMHRMIRLLAKVTNYNENAFVSLPELIDTKNVTFRASIDENLFWQKIFTEIKKQQPKTPYLPFSNLLVNNENLNTLILDLDDYCVRSFGME